MTQMDDIAALLQENGCRIIARSHPDGWWLDEVCLTIVMPTPVAVQ
jgi:hypothetical protein